MQLLDIAGLLSEEVEHMMWDYFHDDVVPIVTQYQQTSIQAQQLTREDVEGILCSAVLDQPISTVMLCC